MFLTLLALYTSIMLNVQKRVHPTSLPLLQSDLSHGFWASLEALDLKYKLEFTTHTHQTTSSFLCPNLLTWKQATWVWLVSFLGGLLLWQGLDELLLLGQETLLPALAGLLRLGTAGFRLVAGGREKTGSENAGMVLRESLAPPQKGQIIQTNWSYRDTFPLSVTFQR